MKGTSELVERFRAKPGKKVSLQKFSTNWTGSYKAGRSKRLLAEGVEQLADLQDQLYAQDTYSVLLIFQAMDAAGKDGTIKHVMSGINPQGCQVFSFKAPSTEELDHGYLWRSVKALPERGRIGIHNRSYYEEVLVARVHPEIMQSQRLPAERKVEGLWKDRFEQIRHFEKYLVENGTIPIKFFLNVSKEEQKKRFLARIDQPEKNWKFALADVRERRFWSDYQKAYEDAITHTSTPHAPWYIVPADNKWFMRIVVAEIIIARMKALKLAYPTVDEKRREELKQVRKVLVGEGD